MKIVVFGSGYVGLVTGTCFAEMGNEVICCDVDRDKINTLNQGISPIYEPGLQEMLQNNLRDGRLQFTYDLEAAVVQSDMLFIAVGTPSDKDGQADLRYVLDVAKTIGMHMHGYCSVIIKSTVPVGTGKKVAETISACLAQRGVHYAFDMISNPEFLKEGTAISDCLEPSRVVIGVSSEHAAKRMHTLYEPFLKNGKPLIVMDVISSELTKYAANAMLATKISFMNELSRICEHFDADIEKIRFGIGSDERIGRHFIYPGLGYGGSCFPKDIKALIHTAHEIDEQLHILEAVEATNAKQKQRFFERIEQHFTSNLADKKIALWGLSFKPGTDDIRDAPSLFLIDKLLQAGANVSVYDPVAMEHVKKIYANNKALSFAANQYDALKEADALCVVTEWKQFREPNFQKMADLMHDFVIFDGRNIYDINQLKNETSCIYYSIGRPNITKKLAVCHDVLKKVI